MEAAQECLAAGPTPPAGSIQVQTHRWPKQDGLTHVCAFLSCFSLGFGPAPVFLKTLPKLSASGQCLIAALWKVGDPDRSLDPCVLSKGQAVPLHSNMSLGRKESTCPAYICI